MILITAIVERVATDSNDERMILSTSRASWLRYQAWPIAGYLATRTVFFPPLYGNVRNLVFLRTSFMPVSATRPPKRKKYANVPASSSAGALSMFQAFEVV